MTVRLDRIGFSDFSKRDDRPVMRYQSINGLVRGRKAVTPILAKGGSRAGGILNMAL